MAEFRHSYEEIREKYVDQTEELTRLRRELSDKQVRRTVRSTRTSFMTDSSLPRLFTGSLQVSLLEVPR